MAPAAPRTGLFPWYHGWNIVAVCVLAQVAGLALTLNCFSLFLDDWTREFGVPVSTLSIAVTFFSLGAAVTAPMAGWAADRFPARWIFGLALLGLVAFHTVMGFLTEGWQVVALYSTLLPFAIGFSASVPCQALVSRWFVRKVGLAMGLTAFGLALAGAVFPALIVLVLPAIGWRAVWWLFAGAIAVIAIPAALIAMRDRPTPEEGAHYVGTSAVAPGPSSLTARDVFRRRNFWLTLGVFVPVQCASMGVSINLAPIVTSHGFSAATAGLVMSLTGVTSLAAKLAAGVLADRLGNRLPLMLTALISATGMMVMAFLADHLAMLFVGMVLMGLSSGVWTLLASATAAEFGADGFGRAFGLICAFSPIGALAPPLVARLQEASGSYAAGLAGLGLFALTGAAAALMMKERRPGAAAGAPLVAEAAS